MTTSFIDQIAALPDNWHAPTMPTLTDPQWLQRFEQGNEQTKRNLAHAWWWCYTQEQMALPTNSGTIWSANYALAEHSLDWLARIAPYGCGELTSTALTGPSSVLSLIAATGEYETEEVPCYRQMLTGTPQQQLDALIQTPHFFPTFSRLWQLAFPKILQRVLIQPGCTDTHRHAACVLIFAYAVETEQLREADVTNSLLRPWFDLGVQLAQFDQADNRPLAARQIKELLRAAPLAVSLPVLHMIFAYNITTDTYESAGEDNCKKYPQKKSLLAQWFPAPADGSRRPVDEFMVATEILPGITEALAAACALDLSFEDACTQVLSMHRDQPSYVLPVGELTSIVSL